MSEKRVSNETLGKVIVQVVSNLEKNLKASEKVQKHTQEKIEQIGYNIIQDLEEESRQMQSFKLDLSPLDVKMNNYLEEIKKASEKTQKDLKSPILGLKVLGLFFGLFCAVLVFFFFFNEQAKELKKERADKEHFIEFIKSSDKRIEEYKTWSK